MASNRAAPVTHPLEARLPADLEQLLVERMRRAAEQRNYSDGRRSGRAPRRSMRRPV